MGSKSLDIPFKIPPYEPELVARNLLPAKCTVDQNLGKKFTMEELQYQIAKSKKNSAPGFDGISNAYIKKLKTIHK